MNPTPPPAAPLEQTVQQLLQQLTRAEKASLSIGSDFWHTAAVERLGIERIMVSDGPHGLRKQPDDELIAGAGSLPATCFPTASALGSSWDADLALRVGVALGRQARAEAVSVLLGPGINIKRSPLCGRNFEYLSEDPLLSGVLGAATVEGIQSQGVGASVKHFAANNQETDRLRVSADVDERTLREIYLPAFERVVTQARPWTVMCAYNKVNGTYASEHRWLLTTVLRQEWGFDGLVVSDWGAVHDRPAAVAAGLDLEMPPALGLSDRAVLAAVEAGTLDEALLDAAVGRVLALVARARAGATIEVPGVDVEAQHELAREAARGCAVLLKNEDDVLPLNPAPGARLAVIGEFARTPRYQGAGSSRVNPTRLDVALDELRALAPAGVEIEFAAGFTVPDQPGPAAIAAGPSAEDLDLAESALALAATADTVVLFLGLPPGEESEGFDRTRIDLPEVQLDLLARLAEVNPRIAVVLANGSAVGVAGWQDQAPAVLECWLSGQGAGRAVAELLFGVVNPSGKLAETLPIRLEDNPSYLNFPGDSGHVRYGEGIFVGYRGYDAREQAVAYPFGHGLSYTTFEYDDLILGSAGSEAGCDLEITVGCRVTNTGSRAGRDVVQLYMRDVDSSVSRPVRELKAFAKVSLDPGESVPVTFTLIGRDLSFWSTEHERWLLESGTFEFAVGASSRDLRLRGSLDVDAPRVSLPLTRMSTLEEWLADPEAGPRLIEAVGTDEAGQPVGILGNPVLISIIGNFPISTLSVFGGLGITEDVLREIVDPSAS